MSVITKVMLRSRGRPNGIRPNAYLGSTSDHVLDEVPVSRSINDGHIILGSFKLPQGNIDGDASLALSLQFIQNPGILERALQKICKTCYS